MAQQIGVLHKALDDEAGAGRLTSRQPSSPVCNVEVLMFADALLGVPFYDYSIMGPKTLL